MAAFGSAINRLFLFLFIILTTQVETVSAKEDDTAVDPYLMPCHHPIKPTLDHLFSAKRVTLNLDTLEEAGFDKSKPRKFTKLIVTKHPSFPGYVFKLYLDAQRPYKNMPEHHFWIMRAEGAVKIRNYIREQHLEDRFKVPKKWIYFIPGNHLPPEGYYTKTYLLVEEDMDILSKEDNASLWGSEAISYALLDDLYDILKVLGLQDCAKPDNIPFSVDGRIAFIDTQSHGCSAVRYEKLNPYLSHRNKTYWKKISQ